ncbi:cell envelope integrity protein TolA [Nostoc sp. PCC 7107]|uniref:cell envelope integrity protein TolA n=1 Tax=Nostoc sp. PCC 7107 TaxID=317936 RepID=UPI00029EF02E|nr:cell envelope integrity protein TolA [Nostoc sp. PCC 7107]AFY41280.1 hypothetical protein Nos7107_0607 [Nostoc sp. PCC 7107]
MYSRIHKLFQNASSSESSNKNPFAPRSFKVTSSEEETLQAQQKPNLQSNRKSGDGFPNVSMFLPRPPAPTPRLQMKLTIGQSGDTYEQEADQLAADAVQQINAKELVEEDKPPRSLMTHGLTHVVQQNKDASKFQNPVELEQINQAIIQRCLNLDDPSWEASIFSYFVSYALKQAKQTLQDAFTELKDLVSRIEESISTLKENNFVSDLSQLQQFIETAKAKPKITYSEGQDLLEKIKQHKSVAEQLEEEVETAIEQQNIEEQKQKEQEEENKKAELKRQKEAEIQQKKEEELKQQAELKQQEEIKRQEEAKIVAEQEAQKKEEARKKQEEKNRRKAEARAEKKRQEQAEKEKKQEAEQKELERKREERRKLQDEEEKKRQAIEMQRQEEKLKKQEEERKRQEEENKKKKEKIDQLEIEAQKLEPQITNKSANDVTKELQNAFKAEYQKTYKNIQGKDPAADQSAIETFKKIIPLTTQIYNELESISANEMQMALKNSYINSLCNNLKQTILGDKGISDTSFLLASTFKKEVGKICKYYQEIEQLELENNTIKQNDNYPPEWKRETNDVFTQLDTNKNNYDKGKLGESISQFKRDHVQQYYQYFDKKAKAEAIKLAYEKTVEGQFMQNPSVKELEKLVTLGEVQIGKIKSAYITSYDNKEKGEFSIECPLEIGQEQYRNVVVHVHCNSDGSAKDGNSAHFKLANEKYHGKTWELSKMLRDNLIPSEYAMRNAGETYLGNYLDKF